MGACGRAGSTVIRGMSDWLALWEDAMRRAREAPSVPVALCDIVAPELRRIQDTAKRYVHVITGECLVLPE